MPREIAGVFGMKTGEGLAEAGERLEKEYAPSPSVSGDITKHPSLLVNPKWWASTMPSLAIQLLPIAIAAFGGEAVAGAALGAEAAETVTGAAAIARAGRIGGEIGGSLIGVSDAGQRMMNWEKEHGKELPAAEKILIGLGAGAAGAYLPGKTLGKLVGPAVKDEAGRVIAGSTAEKAIQDIFKGKTGQAIATRAVNATMGGGAMAGFAVIENAFEHYGYNPDREVTQGVLESLILGTAVSGIHIAVGDMRNRLASDSFEERSKAQTEIEEFQQQSMAAYDEALGKYPGAQETTDIERIRNGMMSNFEEIKAQHAEWAEDAAKIQEIQKKVAEQFKPMATAGAAATDRGTGAPLPEALAPEPTKTGLVSKGERQPLATDHGRPDTVVPLPEDEPGKPFRAQVEDELPAHAPSQAGGGATTVGIAATPRPEAKRAPAEAESGTGQPMGVSATDAGSRALPTALTGVEGKTAFELERGEPTTGREPFTVTKEHLQDNVFRGSLVTDVGNDRFHVELPGGSTIAVHQGGMIEVDPDRVAKDYDAFGIPHAKEALGKYTVIGPDAFMALATGAKVGTVYHEAYHIAEGLFLTDDEIRAIEQQYGAPEARAKAYEEWASNPQAAPNTIWQKIKDLFMRLMETFRPTAEGAFKKIESGEAWQREAKAAAEARGTPKTPDIVADVQGALTGQPSAGYSLAREGVAGEEDRDVFGRLTAPLRETQEAAASKITRTIDLLKQSFTPDRGGKPYSLYGYMDITKASAEKHAEIVRMTREIGEHDARTNYTNQETLDFAKAYQTGQHELITDPFWQSLARFVKDESDRQMATMGNYGKAPKMLKDHLDQLWEASPELDRVYNAILTGTPLRGPGYYYLARTIPDTPTGIAMGLKPRFPTLIQTILAGRGARESGIMAMKLIDDIKKRGGMVVVRSLKDAPEEWRRYPGAFGEVWEKVDRPGGQMIPGMADEETMPMGGGPERAGYEEVPGVKGWMRRGFRVGPDELVRHYENFTARPFADNPIAEMLQGSIYGFRTLQMFASAWHFSFEGINSMASRAGMGLMDTVGGLFTLDLPRMAGGLGKLATAPFALPINIRAGLKWDRAVMDPNDPNHAAAKELLAGGTRVAANASLSKVFTSRFKEAWDAGPLRHPMAAGKRFLETGAAGLMDYVVPQGKNGETWIKYAHEVERFERVQGRQPDADERLRIAYEVRNQSDGIWGGVAQDNVAMDAYLKKLLGFMIQFPRFNIGTVQQGYRTIKGAMDFSMKAVDWARGKEVRTLEMKDRLALQYAMGLVFTVGAIGGLMHWGFNKKPPEEMKDYFFPRTGEIMSNGAEERLQLPSYLKDAMGIWTHPWRTLTAKESTVLHIVSDLIANKDYWGNQIVDPHEWAGAKAADIAKYIGKAASPFVLQSYQQAAKQTPERGALAFLGVRPVPREVANTPAQNVIDEYNQLMRAEVTTKEAAEMKRTRSDLLKLAKGENPDKFEEAANKAVSEGKATRQQIKGIIEESQVPAGMGRFVRLPLEWKLRTWNEASDYEKGQWAPYLYKAVITEKPETIFKLREPLAAALREAGHDDAADMLEKMEMPEEPLAGMDMSALGVQKAAPEMQEDLVDYALTESLGMKMEDLLGIPPIKKVKTTGRVTARPPSEKKQYLEVLGL